MDAAGYRDPCIFPDLKWEKVNFHCWIPQATFWVLVNNSMCHNGSKMASKLEKHHVSQSQHHPKDAVKKLITDEFLRWKREERWHRHPETGSSE
jgi:hypothetical protein